MLSSCIQNLIEIKKLCNQLSSSDFIQSQDILSGASIGQHIRHIIELYQAVEISSRTAQINYDSRKRNPEIQQNPLVASEAINQIISYLSNSPKDGPITLTGDFCSQSDRRIEISTSIYRELAYNLEHAIHHQALIKVGLIGLKLSNLVGEDFGVAPATIRYRKKAIPITPN